MQYFMEGKSRSSHPQIKEIIKDDHLVTLLLTLNSVSTLIYAFYRYFGHIKACVICN